jgi:hypothetical protein
MRLANRSDALFRRHEPVRFAMLVVFMSALATFAVWRLVAVTRGNSRPGWLIVAFLAGVMVCSVAWVTFLGVPFREQPDGPPTRLSCRTLPWLAVVVGVAAVVADEPEQTSPVRFWQPGWLQLIGGRVLVEPLGTPAPSTTTTSRGASEAETSAKGAAPRTGRG